MYLNNSCIITETSFSDFGRVIVCDTKFPEVFETNLQFCTFLCSRSDFRGEIVKNINQLKQIKAHALI